MKPDNSDENAYGAKLMGSIESLVEKIRFTREELDAIEKDGKNISIYLDVKDISDTISKEEKLQIERSLKAQQKVGLFLDINLFKKVDGQEAIKIESTSGNIQIAFELPEELINNNPDIIRKFSLFALHDGKVVELVADYKDGNIIFETDRCSTYALTYTDTKVNKNDSPAKGEPSSHSSSKTSSSNNPITGDTGPMLWVVSMMMSTLGIACTVKSSKRKIIK